MTTRYRTDNPIVPKLKHCPACNNGQGAFLPGTAFHRDRSTIDGLSYFCRECRCANRRASYDRHGETLRTAYGCLRTQARIRGATFKLTFDDFVALRAQPCIYGTGRRPEITIGIDRRNPELGYTAKNSFPCCGRHNLIKGNVFSHEDMLRIIKEFPVAQACGNCGAGRKRLPYPPQTSHTSMLKTPTKETQANPSAQL